jgi:hypothetical protein
MRTEYAKALKGQFEIAEFFRFAMHCLCTVDYSVRQWALRLVIEMNLSECPLRIACS